MKKNNPITKLLILLANFAVSYLLLRLIIEISERTGMLWVYYIGTALYGIAIIALFIVFFALNGYTFDKEPRTRDELPVGWSDKEKDYFMEKQPEIKEKAKKLLLFLLPLILTMCISYIELYFFS